MPVKKNSILIIFLLVLSSFSGFGQQVKTFQKSYGGSGADYSLGMVAMQDKGYLIAGRTASFGSGGTDILITRTDSLGKAKWAKTYGGTMDEAFDLGSFTPFDIIMVEDSNFVICTGTKSYGSGGGDIYLLKIDKNGQVIWTRTIGKSNSDETGASIIMTPDSGFILTGLTKVGGNPGDVIVVKTNDTGGVTWVKTYGNTGDESGWRIIPSIDGKNYLITGLANVQQYDFYLLKISGTGTLLWSKVYGNTFYDVGQDVDQLPDGSIYICGNTTNDAFGGGSGSSADNDLYILKLDSVGNIKWGRHYGGNGREVIRCLIYNSNSNTFDAVASGSSYGPGTPQSMYYLNLDTSGIINLMKTYGTNGFNTAGHGNIFHKDDKNNISILASATGFGAGNMDFYFIKTDSLGNTNNCKALTQTPSTKLRKPLSLNHSTSISTPSLSVGKGVLSKSVAINGGTGTLTEAFICEPFITDFKLQSACKNIPVQFTDSSYKSPTTWLWNFGDPSSGSSNLSTIQNPIHTYSDTGTYFVKLVSSKTGAKDSIIHIIKVYDLPTATINSSDTTICFADSFQLSGNVTGGSFYWSPGKLVSDSLSLNPWTHNLTTTNFVLTAINTHGCTVSKTVKVTIDTSETNCGKVNNVGGVINKHYSVYNIDTCFGAISLDSTAAFMPGDKAFLIQMTGAEIDTTNTSNFGNILSFNGAGLNEYVIIDSVSDNIVYINNKLLNKYDNFGRLQLVSVPVYENLYINSAITAPAWDGFKGGIVLFEATGTVYQNADIDVTGKGFRGGTFVWTSSSCLNSHKEDYYYPNTSNSGSGKGEGIAEIRADFERGRGANANGGGGGNSITAGGGGGGNYTSGGLGGKERSFCSPSSINGGVGGKPLDAGYNSGRIFFGGGGGAGNANSANNPFSNGASGGGIVLIKANNYSSNAKWIKAKGAQIGVTNTSGGGGGGGGGTIILDINSWSGDFITDATGGKGTSPNTSGPFAGCAGAGGGGSGGVVYISQPSKPVNLQTILTGGLTGFEVAFGKSSCGSNGALPGEAGKELFNYKPIISTESFTRPQGAIDSLLSTVCLGDSLQLSAAGGVAYTWSPGNLFNDSTIQNPKAKLPGITKYEVWIYDDKGCFKIDSITVTPKPSPVMPPVKVVCADVLNDSSISILWETNLGPDSGYFGNYNIYRKKSWEQNFTLLSTDANINSKAFLDNTAYGNDTATYVYQITAKNTCGIENQPGQQRWNLVLKATRISDIAVKLSWSEPFIGQKANFVLERNPGLGFEKVADLDGVTEYIYSSCDFIGNFRLKASESMSNCISTSNITNVIGIKDSIAPVLPQIIAFQQNTNLHREVLIYLDTTIDGDLTSLDIIISRAKNGGTYQVLDTVKSFSILNTGLYNAYFVDSTVSFAQPDSNKYCYRAQSLDTCGNFSMIIEECPPFVEAFPGNLEVKLNLSPFTNFINIEYEVFRKVGNGAFVQYASLNGTDSIFTDTALDCGVEYTYYVHSNYLTGQSKFTGSNSNLASATPFDTIPPSPPQLKLANVVSNNVNQLTFIQSTDKNTDKYFVYGAKNGGGFSLLDSLGDNNLDTFYWQHLGVNTLKDRWCYYLTAKKECGNTISVPSDTHCVMQLTGVAGNTSSLLQWADYKGFTIDKYIVERLNASNLWEAIDSVSNNILNYADENLHCGKWYQYRIKARPNGGNNYVSYSDTIAIKPFDTIAPAKVNMLNVSALDNASAEINFNAVADADVVKYELFVSENGGSYNLISTFIKPFLAPLQYAHNNIDLINNTYCYRVLASDSCGNISQTSETHCVVKLQAVAGNNSATLRWSRYKGFDAINTYIVQRKNALVWDDIATISDTNFTDQPLTCNLSQEYRIFTIEGGGDNKQSFSNSLIVTPFDTAKPLSPAIKYVTVKDGFPNMAWQKSASIDVRNYIIYRKKGSGNWDSIAYVNDIDTFTDISADASLSAYCYKIQAQDSCAKNKSPLSGEHCTMLLSSSVSGCEKAINLNWLPYKGWNNISKIEIYRAVDGGAEVLLETLPANAINFKDSLLDYHLEYCYRVAAYELGVNNSVSWSNVSCNNTFFVDTAHIYTVSKMLTSATNGSIKIKWKSQAGKPHFSHYKLYYSQSGLGAFNLLDGNIPIAKDSFIHSNINTRKGAHYYYLINTDSCGTDSDPSSTHKAIDLEVEIGQLIHDLSWTKYEGFDVQEYRIQRFSGTEFVDIDTLVATDTFLRQFPAPCNYHIIYRVGAVDADGRIAYSDTMGRVAIDTVFANGASLQNVSINSGSQSEINFRGSDSLDVYAYTIQRSKDGNWGTAGQVIFTSPGDTHTFNDAVNTTSEQLCYTIITLDSCLNATMSADTFCAIQLKGQELNLANTIAWHGFKGYDIDKYSVLIHNGLNWDTLSTTTSDTNYLHQPLSCNVPVTYKIAGTENGGRITLSDSITLIPYDTIKPAQPTMHFTSVLKDGKIYISWPQSADSDVKLYEISIRSQNGNWNIEDTLENTFEYTFSGLNTMDSLYNFSIKAIDSCAENTSVSSDYHAPVQLKGAPKNLSNLLEWASYEGFGGIEKHIIYIYENGWQKLDSTLSNTTNYTHTPLNCNVPRIYKVLTVSQNADYESWSDSIVLIPFDTIKPAQPTMHYTSVLEDGKIYVSWPQSADNDVKLYEISFRSQNGNWKIEDTLENTFEYTFSGLNTMDSLYNFSIKAIDSCAENTSVASDYHAPVQLKGAPKNLSNLLEWAAYEGFAGIEKHIIYIYENGWKKLDSTLSNTTTYTHTPLNCNVPRIYKVLTVSQNADYESWSDSIVLIPFDTIKPAQPGINYTTVNDGESIFISWQASDLDVKKYELSYRTENGDWQIRDTVQDALEYVFTGLEPVDSTYNFRISAIDSCAENTSIYSEFHSPVQLRGEPKNLSNYLHWSAYKGFDVKQYYIYNYNNGWNKIDSTPASTLEYTHLPLACNVPQYYKVYALDVKNAFVSVSDSIQLIPFDTLKPAAPVMHAVSVEDDRSIKLSWSYDTASDVKYFEVWRNSNGGSYSLQSTVIYDSTFTDVNVSAQSNIYSYYVIAIDSCNLINRSGASDTDRIVTLQLASGACLPEIRLSWTHYVDFEHGVDGYDIFRKTALETNYTKINTVKSSDSTYKDATVLLGNTYFYKIRAFDIESSYESYSDSSGLEPYQYPVPDAPNMLYATVQQTGTVFGSIYVEWEKYFIPGDTFARGYKLYHSLNNGTYNLVHTQHGLDKTDFLHKNINTSAGLHKYYVRVFNLCDIEGDTSRNFRPANLEVYNRNLAAYVSWHPFKGENVIKYELYRARNQASPMLLQTFSSSDTSYADTNIFCGNNYTYSLRVYLGNGRISYADTVSIIAFDTIPPAVPQLYYVSVDTTLSAAGKISMMWKGNSEKNRAGYRIYRSVNGGSMQLHVIYLNKNIGDIFWEDVNLNTKDNYYSYAISSIDSCQENESEMSETHRSIYLKTQAMSQYMQLNWHIYTGWENWLYVVEKQESGKPWRTIDTLAANQVSYHDSDVICHSFYNYRIRGIEDTTVWISFSNTAGDTAFETALPAAPLIASASVTNTGISDGKILLSWQKSEAKDAATYNILRSEDGNNWLPVISNHTDLFFEDFGINTSERSYYYTINTVDSCGNISDTFSSPHKTILLNASAGNSQNNLVWSAYQGWKVKEYAIYKDGVKSFSVPGDVTSFKDTQVFCTKMYNYHIEAIADSNIVLSALSNIDSAKSYDTRARKIYLNTVTVSKANTEVTLTWDESDNFDTRIYYIYKRSGADNSLALLDSTTALTYTETQDSIRYSDCYFVHAVDYCNNISAASNPGCIMILTGKNFTDFHNLSWNEYREWKDGVKNYRIFKKEDNQNWSEIGFTDKTSFTDNFINDTISNHCYQVEASENIGSHNALSLSTTLCLHQDPIVYIPNAFTPGITSEGINDVFGPKGLNIRNYKMQIYNRWGQLVYDTQSGKPWDGSINGDAAMEGVYLYIITIDSYNPNASKRVKGTVTILK